MKWCCNKTQCDIVQHQYVHSSCQKQLVHFSPDTCAATETTETDLTQSRISCQWAAYVGVQLDFCAARLPRQNERPGESRVSVANGLSIRCNPHINKLIEMKTNLKSQILRSNIANISSLSSLQMFSSIDGTHTSQLIARAHPNQLNSETTQEKGLRPRRCSLQSDGFLW